jgi:hypothetical protein
MRVFAEKSVACKNVGGTAAIICNNQLFLVKMWVGQQPLYATTKMAFATVPSIPYARSLYASFNECAEHVFLYLQPMYWALCVSYILIQLLSLIKCIKKLLVTGSL